MKSDGSQRVNVAPVNSQVDNFENCLAGSLLLEGPCVV